MALEAQTFWPLFYQKKISNETFSLNGVDFVFWVIRHAKGLTLHEGPSIKSVCSKNFLLKTCSHRTSQKGLDTLVGT